jgi:hypothetical protein
LQAEEPTGIQSALETKLLEPGQSVREVKAFIQPRIIQPPKVSDRAKWEVAAARFRQDLLEQIVFRGTAAAWRSGPGRVEWLDTIAGGPGYSIRKFRYEALSGMWIPALLYVPDKLEGRVPLAINVNGHAPEGKAVDYKQLRSINLVKRGMLVLNLEWFGMGQLRTSGFSHYRMNQLDLCGASGLAPFYLALSRALDLGLKLEHADPDRVAVSGLSGGGWQTILISGLDERVTLANPVAGYGSFHTNLAFDDLGDSEQAPNDMAVIGDYAHLTALRAPRPTLLTYNASDDCCFKSGHTLEPLLNAARPIFALYGAEDRLRSHVNHVPGTHNFDRENREQFYALLGDFFYPGDGTFVRTEIDSQQELKTAEELHVPLPEANLDFHRLAQSLSTGLPRQAALPTDKPAAEAWQQGRREQLRALLRVPSYRATAQSREIAPNSADAVRAPALVTAHLLKLEGWTLPAIELTPLTKAVPRGVQLLVADAGRGSLAKQCAALIAQSYRVVALDPFLWGESKLKGQDPDYLFPLLVAAAGERPLGIQAAQLVAAARWLKAKYPQDRITLSAFGPRSSAAAQVVAALEPKAFEGVEVSQSLASFHQLLDEDKTVETLPELFAFGLLAEFDVRHLVALAAPLEVTFREPSERTRRELAALPAWYKLLGHPFEPAR